MRYNLFGLGNRPLTCRAVPRNKVQAKILTENENETDCKYGLLVSQKTVLEQNVVKRLLAKHPDFGRLVTLAGSPLLSQIAGAT